MRYLSCWILLSLLPIGQARAFQNAAARMTASAPDIFQLDPLVGFWECNGTAFELKSGAASSVAGTWEFKYDCEHGLVTDAFTSHDGLAPFTAWGWSHYDQATQSLVRNTTDSDGTWANAAALGWADGILVWRGSMNTVAYGPYDVYSTITSKASTLFWMHVVVRPAGHQRWFDRFKGTCRRNPPIGR